MLGVTGSKVSHNPQLSFQQTLLAAQNKIKVESIQKANVTLTESKSRNRLLTSQNSPTTHLHANEQNPSIFHRKTNMQSTDYTGHSSLLQPKNFNSYRNMQ